MLNAIVLTAFCVGIITGGWMADSCWKRCISVQKDGAP